MTELIERELELPASAEDVWRAMTDPAWLATWLAEEVALELWPGGEARFVVDGEELSGWVEEATAPGPQRRTGRLVFWWGPDQEPATRVDLTVSETDDGSVLRVVETRPLQTLDAIGVPLPGAARSAGYGPVLVAA
jgi:uncharacterized protein YndB with AHSA1/START domain